MCRFESLNWIILIKAIKSANYAQPLRECTAPLFPSSYFPFAFAFPFCVPSINDGLHWATHTLKHSIDNTGPCKYNHVVYSDWRMLTLEIPQTERSMHTNTLEHNGKDELWMDFNSGLVPHNKAQLLSLIMQICIKEDGLSLALARYKLAFVGRVINPIE